MKKIIIGTIFAGFALISAFGSSNSSQPATVQTQPAYTETISASTQVPTTNLSNNNYYTNSVGNQVHSPAYTPDNSVPAGASAQCRDGTYSFSQSRRGTCSHHGGVARWL